MFAVFIPWFCGFSGAWHDVILYARWAEAFCLGRLPWRDVPFEYPPLAAPLVWVPALVSPKMPMYAYAFVSWMALWDLLQKWMLSRQLQNGWQKRLFWFLATASAVILNYTYLKRFDVVAACGLSLALLRWTKSPSDLWAWVWFAVAVGVKLYPIVLVPWILMYLVFHGATWRRMACGIALFSAIIGGGLCVGYGFAGLKSLDWILYHQLRGLQIASTYVAGYILFVGGLGCSFGLEDGFGCSQILAPWGKSCAAISFYVWLFLLAITFAALARQMREHLSLWRATLAVLLATLLASKVFSPQYIVWLVMPACMLAVLDRRRGPWVALGLIAMDILTMQLFPHETYLARGDTVRQLCLIGRAVVMIVLWLYLLLPEKKQVSARLLTRKQA